MSKLLRPLVPYIVVALACGCAADNPRRAGAGDRPQDTPGSSGAPTPTSSPGHRESIRAVSVTVKRGGGLAPTEESLVFASGEPPPRGRTGADVRDVLEMASDPALRRVEMPPLPKDECCDRQSHLVTITWDDGASRTYRTLDGVEQPHIFRELLSKAG